MRLHTYVFKVLDNSNMNYAGIRKQCASAPTHAYGGAKAATSGSAGSNPESQAATYQPFHIINTAKTTEKLQQNMASLDGSQIDVRDEQSGFWDSMGRYSKGGNDDRQRICAAYNGGRWDSETITATQQRTIPDANLVFTGVSQPEAYVQRVREDNRDG